MPKRLLLCWELVARWLERLTPLFVLIGVLVLAGLVVQALHQQQEIRAQRAGSILLSCEETNARNRNTVHEYDVRIAKVGPKLPPEQRAQLKQTRDFTVGLINALAPVEDCHARLRRFNAPHPGRHTPRRGLHPGPPVPPPVLARP